jgi:hypothetical protein
MATTFKVKTLAISTEADLATMEAFLSSVKAVHHIVYLEEKVLVVYEEK